MRSDAFRRDDITPPYRTDFAPAMSFNAAGKSSSPPAPCHALRIAAGMWRRTHASGYSRVRVFNYATIPACFFGVRLLLVYHRTSHTYFTLHCLSIKKSSMRDEAGATHIRPVDAGRGFATYAALLFQPCAPLIQFRDTMIAGATLRTYYCLQVRPRCTLHTI